MMTASMETGTQLPYIRKAVALGYGVLVLNTNDNRPEIEVIVLLYPLDIHY